MKFFLICFTILFCLGCSESYTQQTIKGTFTQLDNQQLKLIGYNGFKTYTIDSTKTEDKGAFELGFTQDDTGMAYLSSEDGKAFVVILAPDENLKLSGESLAVPQTIKILSGKQNQLFETYASEHIRREQARSAWDYLSRIYQQDSLFARNKVPRTAIQTEIERIKQEDESFLAGLDDDSYVKWFLPLRKLVSSVATVAQYRTEEIPQTLAAFRTIDYTDPRLDKSGLLGDAIEAHFWLIENSGRSLDSVYIEMNRSIDLMIDNLIANEQKLNEITEFLFKLLEKRSLFTSSEYLAVKLLNQVSCTLDEKLAAQLESYRAMKKGNTAPDFAFEKDVLAPAFTAEWQPKRLSDIKTDYTLVIFGASWCPACPDELQQLSRLYAKWKQYGVEVVFVSLDEDQTAFRNFVSGFPFVSICDYQKWDSPVVQAYHVFATPTMYLLDKNRKIILRPNSTNHMDSWVDWFLIQKKG